MEATTIARVEFTESATKGPDAHDAPILGAGTLEIGGDGLRVQGRRTRGEFAAVAGVLVGVAGVIGAAVLLTVLDLEPNRSRQLLAIGMACGVLPGIVVYSQLLKRLRGKPVYVLVPWSALRVLSVTRGRATLRLVAPELRGDVDVIAADAASSEALATLPRG